MNIDEERMNEAAKAIYEAQGLHLSTGREWDRATPGDRHYAAVYATAALVAVGFTIGSPDLDVEATDDAASGFKP